MKLCDKSRKDSKNQPLTLIRNITDMPIKQALSCDYSRNGLAEINHELNP